MTTNPQEQQATQEAMMMKRFGPNYAPGSRSISPTHSANSEP